MKTGVVLPESFLKCVSPQDRAKLRLGLTATEFMAKGAVENERRLQKLVVAYLRQKGIEPLVPAFGKKTRISAGWPDITFAVHVTSYFDIHNEFNEAADYSCGWEVKHGNGQLSDEQKQMHVRLSSPPNVWRVRVIRSLDEAIEELKEMGIA